LDSIWFSVEEEIDFSVHRHLVLKFWTPVAVDAKDERGEQFAAADDGVRERKPARAAEIKWRRWREES